MWRAAENWVLYPAVPPSPPLCRIPTSVTTGKAAYMSCHDSDGSPPPTYRWYRDDTLLPDEPQKIVAFKNATYSLNPDNGNLVSYKALLCTIFAVTVVLPVTSKMNTCTLSVFLRCFPLHPKRTQVSTTVRLSTMPVLLSAVKAREWKSVSALPFNFNNIL